MALPGFGAGPVVGGPPGDQGARAEGHPEVLSSSIEAAETEVSSRASRRPHLGLDLGCRGAGHTTNSTGASPSWPPSRSATPADDLISRLVAADRAQPAVGHADIASTVELMPVTGHKTT
ncbi:hypothetical protein GCM10010430_73470 [Kitasatospora cystarginea]|uniref:Uncharacterized protein n=1 Tax=Kitasatospora cystarginea TaxID=58350 RepID=A0ABN3EZ30_9ACTN